MRMGSVVSAALLVATAASAQTTHPAAGLRALPRVAIELVLTPDLAELEDELEQRMERALGEHPAAPTLDGASPHKLRLVATVRALGATELRGFWLPFSGTYAIGDVRLEVERPVTLPAPTPSPPVPAIVWQAERLIARPWRQVGAGVGGAVDELIAAFLEDSRRARGP
jgi:hypothetical protein